MRGLVLGGVLATLVSCGAAPLAVPPPPSQGGPAWLELTSEHFTVWTDSSPAQARALVRTMEHLRQVVLGVSFFQRDTPVRSFVIAFRNLDEVHAYLPPQFIARAWSARNPLAQSVIVLSTESLPDDRRIVTHELTHVIAFNVIPDQPKWFAEGLAGYFETVRLDDARGTIEVGRPLDFRVRQVRSGGLLSAAQVFACDQPACMDDRFYATTWAIVTYLINERPSELVRYMQRLIETPAADQAKLWAEGFPSLPPSALDREVARWRAYGRTRISEYTATFYDAPPVERALGDADALATRGLLRFFSAPTAVPPEITQALALDPTGVLPNVIAAAATRSADGDKARAVADAHPDDWRAWWLVGMAARDLDASRAARAKMCALLETHPAALPPRMCFLDPAKDPRNLVFRAAAPQINACFTKATTKPDFKNMSLEVDLADTGAVTAARATVGDPAVSACMEAILRPLPFPAGYPGTFHVGSRTAP